MKINCKESGSGRYHDKCRHNLIKRKGTGSAKHFFAGMSVVILVIALSFGFGSFFSEANEYDKESSACKYYKSIQIESGDSLWSIAEKYMGEEDGSVYEYIKELASVNHIKISELDNIREGDYLVVSYYNTSRTE